MAHFQTSENGIMFLKLVNTTLTLSLIVGPRLSNDVKTLAKYNLQSYLMPQHAPKLMVDSLW